MFEANECGGRSTAGLGALAAGGAAFSILISALLGWFTSVAIPETRRNATSVVDYVKLGKNGGHGRLP